MYFLQIFVLLCGLQKIFDQEIPEDLSRTREIVLPTSDLQYFKYYTMCYNREFSTPISFDFWLIDHSKPLKERGLRKYRYIQCILQFLSLFQCKIKTNRVFHFLKKLFWMIGITAFSPCFPTLTLASKLLSSEAATA
ncbi:uncharacterized protein TNIN_203971 [Trichonephila inaurata madagascariensis]|uniref:Uncharacterized protein n=1 Tax=Trichonephila inaurata madagascariensis TaxID=2747483 RepID=A0A8X6X212_9ARAC|nr:uncharacterized protein TNIN_203971 [Trichonephila inaurata madagascariensis]